MQPGNSTLHSLLDGQAMTTWRVLMLLSVLAPMSMSAAQRGAISSKGERPAPRKIDVADGVYLFITAPYGAFGLDGNAIVVTSNDGVLVFDSNGTPSAASAVLTEIRALTKQPVKYVVHSHWHWDHWYGAQVYKRAFSDVKVISHEKSRQMMAGPAIAFNRPALETQLPGYIDMLEKKIKAARTAKPPAPDVAALEQSLADARFFLDQKLSVKHVLADQTFKDRLEINLGGREIRILNAGRAVTPGDAFMYLPKERVVVTGDVLVNPISFALSSYPSEWLKALEAIDALDIAVIVPGHGEPLRDKRLLHATMEVFRTLLAEGKAARERGLEVDHAVDAVMPALQASMVAITGDVPGRNSAFRNQLVDWYMHRVYDELAGPLDDSIAPIPAHQNPSPAQSVVNELLAADRAFSAAGAKATAVESLSAMFAEDVVMPTPPTAFARGKTAAIAALKANPDNENARVEWAPIRGGVSADGQHGFTFGYMTLIRADATRVPIKYVAYWIKQAQGWRVAVYKRARAAEGKVSRDLMPAALPTQMVAPSMDGAAIAKFKQELDTAERAFSDEAQQIGIGPAFAKNGSADAVNVGPPTSPAFVVSAEAIGKSIGAGSQGPGSPVRWAPDEVIVASSGDLGVTFGMIRTNGEVPRGQSGAVPFITIWRRASTSDPWRYVAE
jgi:glyoxylase-like metal-dependent hydrolase (beta-lactamase superfamily II)/ketosteroid isomerase-like protein